MKVKAGMCVEEIRGKGQKVADSNPGDEKLNYAVYYFLINN